MSTSVDHLPDLLSLDVTAGLVKLGLRAAWRQGALTGDAPTYTLNVLGATNASPIVLTVAAGDLGVIDPREGRILHVVVAGVLGNTAANKLDAVKLRNEAWIGVILSPTTIALYDLNNSTGALVASTGNGAYTSGGTVSKALVDAQILVGREHIAENSAAPRIVMVPLKTTYGPRDTRSSFTVAAFSEGELDRERTKRSLATTVYWYEVHVWGIAAPGTAQIVKRSFGAVQQLHDQVIRSAHARCMGVYELAGGAWIDQHEGAPQRIKFGHELVFQLGFSAPVLEEATELSPEDLTVDAVLSITPFGVDSPEEM